MNVIKPPNKILFGYSFSIFLAGSIEMGKAIHWQKIVENNLKDKVGIIYNPRRDDWDSSWEQNIDNFQFRQQVEWELNALEEANKIIMYFDIDTKSPISLLELGLFARTGKLMVCCPNGYWRKGNVDVVCEMYSIKQYKTLEDIIKEIKSMIV